MNAGSYEQNRDFRPISCFISEMIQDMAVVTMERQQALIRFLSSRAISFDLE